MADKKEYDEDLEYLSDYGVYLLSDEINSETCAGVIEFILLENLRKRYNKLTLIINSPGGEVDSGFAVIDAIRGSKIPVCTTGIGIIASMGLAIFIAGEEGCRILTPNTLIMSHQYSNFMNGKHHELISARKGQDILFDMFVNHYKKYTKLTKNDIEKQLLSASDVWFTAKEAKKMGICDIVKDI